MGRKEAVCLVLESIHLGNLEVEQAEGTLLSEVMKVIRDEQDNFRPEEVERIALVLRYYFCLIGPTLLYTPPPSLQENTLKFPDHF